MQAEHRQIDMGAVNFASDGLVPIVIGVTGHRDLRPDDITSLEAKVREIFLRLHSKYPNTPLVTLSPLAEGADRLVARVALEQGSRLIVPLPMTQEEYEKDFSTEDSLVEFRHLLAQAEVSFVVPSSKDTHTRCNDAALEGRAQSYLNAGIMIARHSHILLALWDGVDSGRTGGTSQIVGLRLDGIPDLLVPIRSLLDEVDDGPVYHIVTPRLSNPTTKDIPLSVQERYPATTGDDLLVETQFESVLKRTDNYNREVSSLREHQSVEKSKSYVVPTEEQHCLPTSAMAILNAYGTADALSIHFQQKRRKALSGLFLLVLLAFFFFQVYLEFFERPGVLILYPLTLSAAYLWYLHAKRRDYQDNHLDYRALAEGLRIKLFWVITGLDDYVSDHYLRKHSGDMEWIRRAIRVHDLLNVSADALATNRDHSGATLEMVSRMWVRDQHAYFSKAASRDEGRLEKQERIGNRFFWMALVFVFIVLLIDLLLPIVGEHGKHRIELVHPYLVIIVEMQLAIAAAIGGFSEKMAFAEQAKQYARMNRLFSRASKRIESLLNAGDTSGAKRLIRELGIEALAENGDWVALHRSKPMAVPKGG